MTVQVADQKQDQLTVPSVEELNAMINSGDIEQVKKAENILAKLENGEVITSDDLEGVNVGENANNQQENVDSGNPAEEEVSQNMGVQQQQTTVQQQEVNVPQSGKVKVYYGGRELSYDDPDGFMGRGSLEGLKKSWAHKEAFIEQLKREAHTARDENAQLKQKISELESEIEKLKLQQQSSPSQSEPASTGVDDIEFPQRPDVPIDPTLWSEEDAESMAEYERKRDELIMKLVKGEITPKISQQQQSANPATADIPDEYKKMLEEIKREKEQSQKYQQERQYWDEIENFRKQHKEYNSTQKSIIDLDKDIRAWLDRLADAAGYMLPYGASQSDIQQREMIKQQLFDAYLNGDTNVTGLGVNPPEGYMDYVNIANLDAKRQEFIQSGLLGPNATLHDAWVLLQDKEGVFDKTISKLEADAKAKGVKAVVNTLQQQQQSATVLPNDVGASSGTDVQITDEMIQRALSASPSEIARNPELQKVLKHLVNGE